MTIVSISSTHPRGYLLKAAGHRATALCLRLCLALLCFAGCAGLEAGAAAGGAAAAPFLRDLPENHGFDSAKLAEGIRAMRRDGLRIHSMVIARDGAILSESYFEPYDGTIRHDLASVTKTFMTTLIGIAIDRGHVALDAPMVSYFPGRTIANRDERKERVTVRHLLSCSSGLYGDARDAERTAAEMRASPDWVQFALDRPSVAEPGTRFAYSNLDMHLLSAILQEATGKTAFEYARTELFAPLGIEEASWESDPQGYTRGWGDLALKSVDAAKLGQLFLDGGAWGSVRLVSKDWVARATSTQMRTESWRKEDYGFGWWVSRKGAIPTFLADGRGGQRILVAPLFDLVIATTGGGFEIDDALGEVTPAASWAIKKLRPNPAGVASLRAAEATGQTGPEEGAAAAPEPPASDPPEIARAAAGKTFEFGSNAIGLESVRADFRSEREIEVTMDMEAESSPRIAVIGLDGRYRASRAGRPVLARGSWRGDGSLVIDYDEGPGLNHYEIILDFSPSGLLFKLSAPGSSEILSAQGRERGARSGE